MYGYDEDGLLFMPRSRESARPVLTDDQLAAVEAVLAVQNAAFVLKRFLTQLRAGLGLADERTRLMVRLYRGRQPEEDDVATLAELRLGGMVTGDDPVVLTAEGTEILDEAMRRMADSITKVTAGLDSDQLAQLRHASLQLAVNQLGEVPEPPGGATGQH